MSDERARQEYLRLLRPSLRGIFEKEPRKSEARIATASLERAQRFHLGISLEPMEFTPSTIAQMIEDISVNCDEADRYKLEAIIAALRDEDEHHRLVLSQKARGKFVSPSDRDERWERHWKWLNALGQLESEGMKTEAAIAQIAEQWNVSRATVFEVVKDGEIIRRVAQYLFPEVKEFADPRPDKDGNA